MSTNAPVWFLILLGLVALSRMGEVIYARGLSQKAAERGVKPQKEANFISMVALHICFFVGITLEVLWMTWDRPRWLLWLSIALFILAFFLRLWTLKTLNVSWNVRIIKPPQIITTGPYRYIRHPNYLVVILEIISLPLMGGAYLSAIVFTLWNAWVLYLRIPKEEALLFEMPGYQTAFENKNRLLPFRRRH